jgi:hypothetical protein
MSARYRAAESVARDRKEPHVERREAGASSQDARRASQARKLNTAPCGAPLPSS